MQDNDTMGQEADPTQQQEMQGLNNQLWGTTESSQDALPIPPCLETVPTTDNESVLRVEG